MVVNRRGFTALVDAVFFIALISVASTIIVQTVTPAESEPDVQNPADVLETVFDAKIRYTDIGIDLDTSEKASMPRVAYVSMVLEDGCFENYLREILDSLYPWNTSYHVTLDTSRNSMEWGESGTEPWLSSVKTFQTGFNDELKVTLTVYR